MPSVYTLLVYVHLVGLVVFLLAHGASAVVAFWLKRQTDRTTVAGLLALSQAAVRVSYGGLLLLGIGGLGAAWNAGNLTAPWVVASYVVLAAVIVAMFAVGASYYYGLRDAVAGSTPNGPIDDAGLRRRLDSRRPEALSLIGLAGLLVLVWLMLVKPQ